MQRKYKVEDFGMGLRSLDISTHPLDWDFETFESVAMSLGNCDIGGDFLHFSETKNEDGPSVYHVCRGFFVRLDLLKFGVHHIMFNLMSGVFQIDDNPQIFHMKGYDPNNPKYMYIGCFQKSLVPRK